MNIQEIIALIAAIGAALAAIFGALSNSQWLQDMFGPQRADGLPHRSDRRIEFHLADLIDKVKNLTPPASINSSDSTAQSKQPPDIIALSV